MKTMKSKIALLLALMLVLLTAFTACKEKQPPDDPSNTTDPTAITTTSAPGETTTENAAGPVSPTLAPPEGTTAPRERLLPIKTDLSKYFSAGETTFDLYGLALGMGFNIYPYELPDTKPQDYYDVMSIIFGGASMYLVTKYTAPPSEKYDYITGGEYRLGDVQYYDLYREGDPYIVVDGNKILFTPEELAGPSNIQIAGAYRGTDGTNVSYAVNLFKINEVILNRYVYIMELIANSEILEAVAEKIYTDDAFGLTSQAAAANNNHFRIVSEDMRPSLNAAPYWKSETKFDLLECLKYPKLNYDANPKNFKKPDSLAADKPIFPITKTLDGGDLLCVYIKDNSRLSGYSKGAVSRFSVVAYTIDKSGKMSEARTADLSGVERCFTDLVNRDPARRIDEELMKISAEGVQDFPVLSKALLHHYLFLLDRYGRRRDMKEILEVSIPWIPGQFDAPG